MSKINYKRADSSGHEGLQVTPHDTSDYKPDYKRLRVNTSKNIGDLSFIVISVDNSHVAGGKQMGRLASNNLC